jgi:hypothetical protein
VRIIWGIPKRVVWIGTFLALTLTACGGGRLTVAEYAAQAEELVAVLAAECESLDAEWESQTPSLEAVQTSWERRLAARSSYLTVSGLSIHPTNWPIYTQRPLTCSAG